MRKPISKSELREFIHGYKNIYELPYVSKNGIRFSNNGVSIVTPYGIVRASNGYFGGDKYWRVLEHKETNCDGSIRCISSADVLGKDNSDLEALSIAIKKNVEKNAEYMLKKIRGGT